MGQQLFRQILKRAQLIKSQLKPYLRWVILGGTLFFLAKTLKDNWQEVAAIQIAGPQLAGLATALGVTLLAHIWSGWVWTWILREFKQPVPVLWGVRVYLKTNIAKYLPGNVWHFYGRILAVTGIGISPDVAALSVLIEPVLMAAAALAIALTGSFFTNRGGLWQYAWITLPFVLIAIHPRILNPLMQLLRRLKRKALGSQSQSDADEFKIERYPFWLLMGEMGFLGLRGAGFLLTVLAIAPAEVQNLALMRLPMLLGAFSLAWLLGLVVPGAPGGIGVFEATVTVLLKGQFSAGLILSAVAFYRLISVLAEVAGAFLAWVDLAQACRWVNRYPHQKYLSNRHKSKK